MEYPSLEFRIPIYNAGILVNKPHRKGYFAIEIDKDLSDLDQASEALAYSIARKYNVFNTTNVRYIKKYIINYIKTNI